MTWTEKPLPGNVWSTSVAMPTSAWQKKSDPAQAYTEQAKPSPPPSSEAPIPSENWVLQPQIDRPPWTVDCNPETTAIPGQAIPGRMIPNCNFIRRDWAESKPNVSWQEVSNPLPGGWVDK